MNIDELLESFEKTENAHLDTVGSEHIMLIHDSCVNQRGQVFSFKDNEFGVLTQLLEKTKLKRDEYQFVAAIKSLGVSEKDATTAMIHENRPLLEENIKTAEPDLIDNAYDKFILGKNKLANSTYNLHNDVDSALKAMKHACTKDIVSIDIETTGLDYKKDKITSIGLATGDREAFVIPIYHRESELSDDDISRVRDSFTLLLKDPSIGKIFHNCKFDLKFLKNWGVHTFNNIHDTQIMHSLVDENKPHGLMDIVKEHWPRELEEF